MNSLEYVAIVPRKPPKMGPYRKSAEWVQAIVKHHGLSQERFAEKAGMSRGGVAKLYYGQQRPRFDSLEKLRNAAPPHLKSFDPEVADAGARLKPEAAEVGHLVNEITDDELRLAVSQRIVTSIPTFIADETAKRMLKRKRSGGI